MATANQYIGRREGIGLGIEGTPGTGVAAQVWMRWQDQNIYDKTGVVENDSAVGVVDRVSSSDLTHTWAEGQIGGIVSSEVIGFLLLGIYGTVSTGAPTGSIYPHTFSVNQSSVPNTLTIAHDKPLADRSYAYGVIHSFELTAEAGQWVQVKAGVKARAGGSASHTPSYSTESYFNSQHITAKVAATTGALSGATAIKASRVTLTLERAAEAYVPLGESAPEYDRGVFEARGEIVLRYTDTTYEENFVANTIKALEIALVNGDDDLTFTASQVRYRELEHSTGRDGVVTQTLSFYCEYDESTGKSIEAVLNNTRTAYVAA